MQYIESTAKLIAKRWNLPTSTVSLWRRNGSIPDHRALGEPLDKAGLQTEEKLVKLVESGWLKAKPLSREIGRRDKINALLTARRYPDDPRYHVRHLDGTEIKQIRPLLDKMQRHVAVIRFMAAATPAGQRYNDVVQADLRLLLKCDWLNTANITLDMNKQQAGRFWAFMAGRPARRDDLDAVLVKLKQLAVLLSE